MAEQSEGYLRNLARRSDDATFQAGIMAMVVADKLAEGDVEGAKAALPAYKRTAEFANQLGAKMTTALGLDKAP